MPVKAGSITVTTKKTLFTTPHPFEQKFGYHRAVRRGPFITVSGTTALKLLAKDEHGNFATSTSESILDNSSKVHFPGDAYGQATQVFETCLDAVTALEGRKEDVIRVRMYVANSADCDGVGEAFRHTFGAQDNNEDASEGRVDMCGVAATMIVVPGGFVDVDILVEIEVDAFVA